MPIEITIPRLGWSMEEGIFGEWLKSPGEPVQAGEMVFLLEGEKAAHEIESFDNGILCVPDDAPQPGDTVKVGQVIGFLLAEGEIPPQSVGRVKVSPAAASISQLPVNKSDGPVPTQQPTRRAAGPAARRMARQLGIDLNAVDTPDPTGRVLCEDVQRAAMRTKAVVGQRVASPRARRRAKELGIDWTQIIGSGRNGRVRERDIIAYRPGTAPAGTSRELAPIVPGRHQPASKLRLAIAQRMQIAVQQAVPVTLNTKVDASAIVAFRTRLKTAGGLTPSFNDILLHLAALTLRELPDLNACWYRDGIHAYDVINIATAVDTPGGLLAPVVQQTDQLSLHELAQQTAQLIEHARAGKLAQQALEGGTFTMTNLGMLGIDAFTPILNLPQAAILGVGRIVEEPVARNSQLQIGHTLTLSLTFDHRVVDGAPAARWLQRLSERIETIC